MKPVDQTTFGVPGGNCFSACVASLLELEVEEVPYFMGEPDWFFAFNRWLRPRGLYAMNFEGHPERFQGFVPDDARCILGGRSPRGPHAVVGTMSGVTLHDPHPSRDGLLDIEDSTILVPVDPARR